MEQPSPRETLEGQIRQPSWSSFTKKATSALAEDEKQLLRQREILQQPVGKRGFETVLASLSTINGTLGNALEGGYNYKETKASNKRSQNAANELDNQGCRVSNVKSSHDISMTMEMASRIQLLVKEISTLKTELSLVKHQCKQLEEENMRLHENERRDVKPEDDDLVSQQLEALLLEKSRLAQENANYARENQVLTEIIDYHRLALQDILSNESIEDAEAAT